MDRNNRLALVFLFTSLFGLFSCVILNDPFKSKLQEAILCYHPHINNSPKYLFLMLTILFFMMISLYDFFIIPVKMNKLSIK